MKRVLMAEEWTSREFELGFAHYAGSAGWCVERGVDLLTSLPEPSRWDGILVWLFGAEEPIVERLGRFRGPIVSVRSEQFEGPWIRVCSDEEAIGVMAADHLLQLGFERFLFLGYGLLRQHGRGKAFRERVAEKGGTFVPSQLPSGAGLSRFDQILLYVRNMLASQPFPVAVFTGDDPLASALISACLAEGIDVPGQVAVVGVDNDEVFSELAPVSISSVDTNRYLHGWKAAETLDRAMQGDSPPGMIIPPAGVIARRSSDVLAVEDASLQKAFRFIADHYTEPITVREIAGAAGISQRGLENKFKRHLSRSPTEVLMQRRIERARVLLRGTQHKIDYIGAASGLTGGERLSRVLKREIGCSPSEYRERHSIRKALTLGP